MCNVKAGVVKVARAALCRVFLAALALMLLGRADVVWAAPTVWSVTPSVVAKGAGNTNITVSQDVVNTGDKVRLNAVLLTTSIVGGNLQATVPSSMLVEDLTYTVDTVTSGGMISNNSVVLSVGVGGGGGSGAGVDITQYYPVLYIVAGLMAASAFIAGFSYRW